MPNTRRRCGFSPILRRRTSIWASASLHMPDRLPEAIAEYQAALRIEPDDADAHYNLGNALARMPGRLPEAIAEYQAALRIRARSRRGAL